MFLLQPAAGHVNKRHQTPEHPARPQTYCTELFEGYPAISVLVCINNSLIYDLLKLRVLQVVAHHHLQHLEKLSVGNVAIFVHVINPESNCDTEFGIKVVAGTSERLSR